MGDRSHLVIRETESQKDNLVILYGHYAGEDNLTAAKSVLEKTDRIGDSVYLTAQLFYEFTRLGNYSGNLGFGLYVGSLDDIDEVDNPAVIVDADTGLITYQGETLKVEPLKQKATLEPAYSVAKITNLFLQLEREEVSAVNMKLATDLIARECETERNSN
jgi:hypothetical protein